MAMKIEMAMAMEINIKLAMSMVVIETVVKILSILIKQTQA